MLREPSPSSTESGRQLPGRFDARSVAWFLGVLLAVVFLLRNSILSLWIPAVSAYAGTACYGLLLVSSTWLVFSKKQFLAAGVILVLACLPGSLFGEERNVSLFRYVGWGALMAVVGPVFVGQAPRQLRGGAWTATLVLLIGVSLASCAWYILGLPVMGRGYFTGVMNHCMLLGPMAGLVVVVALFRAVSRQSWVWFAFSAAALLPCLAAGSRAALLSLLIAGLTVLVILRRQLGRFLPMVALMAIAALVFVGRGKLERVSARVTETLLDKGLQNTRDDLWRARFREIKAHPFLGIGVGVAKDFGVERDQNGNVTVEPGSSYLAVLSMTGFVGGLGFLVCSVWCVRQALGGLRRDPVSPEREAIPMVVFLLVHAVAEGWILAVGSPLCFLFWLCVGRLCDFSRAPDKSLPEPATEASQSASRRLAPRRRRYPPRLVEVSR